MLLYGIEKKLVLIRDRNNNWIEIQNEIGKWWWYSNGKIYEW